MLLSVLPGVNNCDFCAKPHIRVDPRATAVKELLSADELQHWTAPWQISSFPSPPPPIRMAGVKHKGKATQAALKLMVWSLAALLCVVLIGIASVLIGKF